MLGNGHSTHEVFSLYSELADVSGESFAATNLIKRLIKGISYDVCAFKRNTQTAYFLVQLSCNIYKLINACIRKVDNESENSWESYNKYIGKIHPLEVLLFRMSALLERESLPRPDSLDDCTIAVAKWVESRTEIRAIAKEFYIKFPEFVKISDLNARYRLDDSALLSEICHQIRTHSFREVTKNNSLIVGGLISSTRHYANTILSFMKNFKSVSERTMTLSIKCTMLVYTVIYVLSYSSNKEEREKLMIEATWRHIVDLLLHLSTFLNNGDQSSEADLRALEILIASFIEKIKADTRWDITRAFIDLKKKAGHIGRPFHSQTCLLIEQFQRVYDHYRDNKSTTDIALIADVLLAAASALDSAVLSTKDYDAAIIDHVRYNAATEAFAIAESKLKKVFATFHMIDKWAQFESRMESAKGDDQNHLKLFLEKLVAWKDRSYQRDTKQVIYHLKTRKANDKMFKETTRVAEANSKLSSILWAESCADSTILDYGWHFQHNSVTDGTGDDVIGLNHELKDLQGKDGQATLYLISDQTA